MRACSCLLVAVVGACAGQADDSAPVDQPLLRRVSAQQLRNGTYSSVVKRGQVFRLWIRSTPELPKPDRNVVATNAADDPASELVVYFHHHNGAKHRTVITKGNEADGQASGESSPLMEVVVLERASEVGRVEWRLD